MSNSIYKYETTAKCPGPDCGKIHVVKLKYPWTGRGMMRKYCANCKRKINNDPERGLIAGGQDIYGWYKRKQRKQRN